MGLGREEGIYGLEARVAEEVKAREGDGFVDAIYGGEGERAGETGGRARVVGRGSGAGGSTGVGGGMTGAASRAVGEERLGDDGVPAGRRVGTRVRVMVGVAVEAESGWNGGGVEVVVEDALEGSSI